MIRLILHATGVAALLTWFAIPSGLLLGSGPLGFRMGISLLAGVCVVGSAVRLDQFQFNLSDTNLRVGGKRVIASAGLTLAGMGLVGLWIGLPMFDEFPSWVPLPMGLLGASNFRKILPMAARFPFGRTV